MFVSHIYSTRQKLGRSRREEEDEAAAAEGRKVTKNRFVPIYPFSAGAQHILVYRPCI